MTALWNDAEVKWRGQTYRVRPTFALMQSLVQIEPDGFKHLIVKAAENQLANTTVCQIIAAALQSCGVRVSAEDVFDEPEMSCGMGDAEMMAYDILTSFAERGKKKESNSSQPVLTPAEI